MLECVDAHLHVNIGPKYLLKIACHAGSMAALIINFLHTYTRWKMRPHGSTQRLVCEALGGLAGPSCQASPCFVKLNLPFG